MIKLEQLLKERRLEKNLTLEEAAHATKIKTQFLESIEKGKYTDLPSPAYAKGFVLNYAEFLGIPKVQATALFKRDFDEKKSVKVLPEGMVSDGGFPIRHVNLQKLITVGIIVLLSFGFFVYQTRSIFFPPSITLETPKEGATVTREVEVAGKTDNSVIVTINDEDVPVNSNGEFSKKITLFPGQTTIVVRGKNRSQKETIINRTVHVKQ